MGIIYGGKYLTTGVNVMEPSKLSHTKTSSSKKRMLVPIGGSRANILYACQFTEVDEVKFLLTNSIVEKLGEKPKSETKDIDTDEEIIALRKQLDEVKARIQKEKEEKKKAKEKRLAEEKKKADAKKKKEQLKQDRAEAIQNVKKEIIFLGETPLS